MKTSNFKQFRLSARGTARHDLIAGLVLAAVAVFLFQASFSIPVDADETGIGPRSFPQGICLLMGLIGAIMAFQGARGKTAPGDQTKLPTDKLFRIILPLIVISFLYVWFFSLFGYFTATLLALYTACYLFGVRGRTLLLMPPVISLVFYLLFFGLMGVFEPPAGVFSVTQFLKSL